MIEQYYFGQGKIWSRLYGVAGAKWRWWGDVSELNAASATEKASHKESYSGKKATVRSFGIGQSMTLSGTLHQLDTVSLGELLYGEATTVAGGSVVGESLGTVAVGDIFRLANPGASSLVITDSLGTPATIAATHYRFDGRFGDLEFLTLPSSPAPTMPLKAAYSYSGYKQVNFFTKPQPILEFRYEGVNLAENEAPVIVEFYKAATEPLQQLALINNGNQLAGSPFSLEVLLDSSKPVGGVLGQFGRMQQVTTA